jgi:Ca-activated chloride channel family protein
LFVAIVAGTAAIVAVIIFVTPSPRAVGDCVRLVVSSSTEKADLISELASDYNKAGRVFGDRCASVGVYKKTSGAAMESLANGWNQDRDEAPAPQVWLPTSSLWLKLLEHQGEGNVVSGDHPSITKSVLVVAMPRKMADAVHRKTPEPGWSDIFRLATKGWAFMDHPEWGDFVLGRDNPHFSTSGLATTIALYHAAARKQGGITKEDLNDANVRSFVHGVESSVAHYGDDATKFMELLYAEDQKKPELPYVSGIVVQEQLAYLYNKGAPGGDPNRLGTGQPNEPLVAIHPIDGTLELDHPFVTLSSASDEQRAAAVDFRAFLEDNEERFTELGFRNNDGTPTDVLADTLGFPRESRPRLIEPPAADLIDTMVKGWDVTRRPARVLLVVDVSGSMNDPADNRTPYAQSKLNLLRPAALQGLEWLNDRDQVALWTFSSGNPMPYSEQVPMSRVGDVGQTLIERIGALQAKGNTALYQTAIAAHKYMADTINPESINAIVLLSDGRNEPPDETGRTALLNAVNADNLDTSVRIFTIPYGSDADVETLAQVAAASKALTYDATNPVDINKVFVSVFSNF